MTSRVRFTAEAEADVAATYAWYESARAGLGRDFIGAVDAAVAQIVRFPESGRVVRREIRRILTSRFPYGLTYVVDKDELVVLGCFHLRRDPAVWTSRRRSRDA